MDPRDDKVKLLELKSRIKTLAREWELNAATRPRRGVIYKALARELKNLVLKFEFEEHGIQFVEAKD